MGFLQTAAFGVVAFGVASTAMAGGTVGSEILQERAYSFNLDFQPVMMEKDQVESQAANLSGNVIRFAGNSTLQVAGFDSSLGTLKEVKLSGLMNVSGQIFASQDVKVSGYAWGGIEIGALEVDLDFAQYDGGASQQDVIDIFETDAGSDFTVDSGELSFFSGDPLTIDLAASFEYVYEDIAQAGNSKGFTAQGDVELLYIYEPVGDGGDNGGGNPEAVPTPSAAAAGLLAMAGLAVRRRRKGEAVID